VFSRSCTKKDLNHVGEFCTVSARMKSVDLPAMLFFPAYKSLLDFHNIREKTRLRKAENSTTCLASSRN